MSRIDHVALEVQRFDEHIDFLVEQLGMSLLRTGQRFSTGQRIAMLVDDVGFKLELIEAAHDDATTDRHLFQHLAVRSNDVADDHARLRDNGAIEVREPHRLGNAKADTSLLSFDELEVQVVHYDHDSIDLT